MLLELRGQLTCSGCSRSVVIGDSWLAAIAKACDGVLMRSDLHRLFCKKCRAREPNYAEPTDWSATAEDESDPTHYDVEERESPYDFYYYDELWTVDGHPQNSN